MREEIRRNLAEKLPNRPRRTGQVQLALDHHERDVRILSDEIENSFLIGSSNRRTAVRSPLRIKLLVRSILVHQPNRLP